MTSWIGDQVAGVTPHGVTVQSLALREQDGITGHPLAPGLPEPRSLGGSGNGAVPLAGILRELCRTLSLDPRAALQTLGGFRRKDGGVALQLALASLQHGSRVLHAHFGNYAASILPVRRLTGLPLVVSFYGWDASAAPRDNPRMYDELFRESSAVIALSREMQQTLVDLGCPREKTRIVHVSVQGERLRQAMRQARNGDVGGSALRLLTVGRLVEKKGLDDALDALSELRKRGIPFHFRVVGDGPLLEELQVRARGLGIEDGVDFAGALDRDDVFTEMARCDVFFLPSRVSAAGDREGTPTVLIEAGALGIPCVATRHAGNPEIIHEGKTGLLTDERDVRAMADALESLAREPSLRRRLGEAARQHIGAEFERQTECGRLVEIYRECIAADGRD